MHAVCFDLDGTLLHFTREYGAVLEDTFRDVVGESRAEWLETYNECFFERFRACEPRPVEGAFAETLPEYDAADLTESLLRHEIEMVAPAPGIEELFDTLATHDVQIGVVTNGVPHWQRAKLDAHELLEPVDAFVASYEAGAHKPDAAPFRLAEDRLGATHYTMVGDDDADVDGAANAGWASIRYEGDGFEMLAADLLDD